MLTVVSAKGRDTPQISRSHIAVSLRCFSFFPLLKLTSARSFDRVPDKILDVHFLGFFIEVRKTGVGILMVEQNAKQALGIADRGYVLVNGKNSREGAGEQLLNNPEVRKSFLGG